MTFSGDPEARAVNLYSQGDVIMRGVAETSNVSLGFVLSVIACHRQFGQVTNPHTPGPYGRQRILDTFDTLFIREVIEAKPSVYLDELQYKLVVARDVHVSISTTSRTPPPWG